MNICNEDSKIDLVKLNEYTINLMEAAREYLARKDDESRVLEHGRYVRDNHWNLTWFPFTREVCSCCTSIYGNKISGRTLQAHFRSPTHVSTLYNVDRSDLLKFVFIYEHVMVAENRNRTTAINNLTKKSH